MSSKSNKQARVQVQEQEQEFVGVVEYAKPATQELDLAELMTTHKTKSAVIRYLTSLGKNRSEVAKFMGIRYQHVRNVLTQPIKQAAATA